MDQNYLAGNSSLPEDDYVNIKRYLSLFISNWYWFAIALFIAFTIAYGINRYSQQIFSVSSTILINDDKLGSVNTNVTNAIPGGNIFKSQQNLRNEMGILKSFSLNYRVMRELEEFHVAYYKVGRRGIVESKLYHTCPFKVVYDSLEIEPKDVRIDITILDEHKYMIEKIADNNIEQVLEFGKRYADHEFDFIIERNNVAEVFDPDNSNRYYFYFEDPGSLANQYRSKLSVSPIEKEASLVTLSVSGSVAKQEADYLNKLMEIYIRYGLDNKNQTADSTIKFIDDQLKVILDSLDTVSEKLEKFRTANSFMDLSKEGLLIQNRLEKFEDEKTSFELQLQYYNYLSDYLDNVNSTGTIISPTAIGISDPVLLRLVNELSNLQKDRERFGFNINSNQPAIELIDKLLLEARESLKENVKNGIAGLKLLIIESERKIADVELELNKLPSTEKRLVNIQRKFDLNNSVYVYLLEKRSESGIARASNVSDNRIIDTASSFSSVLVRPKTRLNFSIALMLGLVLPMMLIAIIDFFNERVMDKSDVERKTKVPVIGYISHNEAKNEIAVVDKPGSSLAESFRSVRTAIKYYVKENDVAIIAVTSTVSSEGKTFISINLASITAMLGKKVLLIGLDLRRPRINKVFEFNNSPGMSTYLSGNCEYEEVIKKTQIDNLFYAPSGPVPPNPAELLETEFMKGFVDKASKEFDYIIIDTPPVAIVTDSLLLSPYVDLNLFIVRQRYTSLSTLDMIEQLYKQGELKNMAIIINDISVSGYYGYGMRYGYSKGYGYSYGYNYYSKGYYGKRGYTDNSKGYYTED